MNRLLTGNLIRLRKNTVFGMSIVCAMVGPLYTVINNWYYKHLWDMCIQADAAFLLSGADYFFVIALAVAISLFIGTEFSDNTIRNKLIAGHTRVSVFLSNLLASIIVAVTMYLASAAVSCIGIPLLDKPILPIDKLMMQMACAVVSISVIAVFICTVTMVLGNRVVSATVSMLSVIGMQLIPPVLWANVDYYTEYGLLETLRAKIDVFLYDWLPTCQIYRFTSEITDIPIKYTDGDFLVALDENCNITFSNTAKELNTVEVGKLFDRFYTVDSARKSTGLGLSIAKLLTERMNGSIKAEYISDKLSITVSFLQP